MYYSPHAHWLQLMLLVVPVITFGFWPLLRSLNGAPVLIFARINILSQFGLACVYALIFEGPGRIFETFEHFDLRVGSLVLGGYLLGHGDQLGAIPMKYLQPGTTNALVGTVSLLLTCMFNYIQVGARRPDLVFSGLGCALLALIFLSQAVKKSTRRKSLYLSRRKTKYSSFGTGNEPLIQIVSSDDFETDVTENRSLGWSKSTTNPQMSNPVIHEGLTSLMKTNEASKNNPQNELTLSRRKGLIIMAVAGLFTASWGPMSTYARNGSVDELVSSPGLMVFFFTLGEVLAIPDLYLICLYIEPQPEYILTRRRLFWGMTTGFGVASGYFFFFTATHYEMSKIVLPATVIVYCNPLVAVVTDIVRGEFSGAELKTNIFLSLAVTLYICAVLLNSFSATF